MDSVVVNCVTCDAEVWRSIGSLAQDLDPICMACIPAGETPKVAMPQLLEAASALGIAPLDYANYLGRYGIHLSDE